MEPIQAPTNPQVTPPTITPLLPRNNKGKIVVIFVMVIVVAVIVFYFATNKTQPLQQTQINVQKLDDSDLRVAKAPAFVGENSAPAYDALTTRMDPSDLKKITSLIASSTATKLPPLKESKAFLAKYADLLKVFDANSGKTYKCETITPFCSLNQPRQIGALAALRALVLVQEGKLAQAEKSAMDTIKLGKEISQNSPAPSATIAIVAGWTIERYGYTALTIVREKNKTAPLTILEKESLIRDLRDQHKNIFRYTYSEVMNVLNLINSDEEIPMQYEGTEDEMIRIYRQGRKDNPKSWDLEATKKYIYDSTKITLSQIDLPCGSVYESSQIELNFDPSNSQTENYIGKTFYTSGHADLTTLHEGRCKIESIINDL